jgi:quercetin dioxygenase-like cupin family protein
MRTIALLVSILSTGLALAQQEVPANAIQFHAGSEKWVDAAPPLPSGVKIFLLEGNPKQDGIFTMRVKLPPHFKVNAHTHPADERATVIEGSIFVGFGEKLDPANATEFSAGSFYVNPKGSPHYIFTQEKEAIVQVTVLGPWGLNYVEVE